VRAPFKGAHSKRGMRDLRATSCPSWPCASALPSVHRSSSWLQPSNLAFLDYLVGPRLFRPFGRLHSAVRWCLLIDLFIRILLLILSRAQLALPGRPLFAPGNLPANGGLLFFRAILCHVSPLTKLSMNLRIASFLSLKGKNIFIYL
jgi:hypothetical protein